MAKADLIGYVEVKVGSFSVNVPMRAARQDIEERGVQPLASFAVDGESYAILVRGQPGSPAVEKAVQTAAAEALRHLSRKLLN